MPGVVLGKHGIRFSDFNHPITSSPDSPIPAALLVTTKQNTLRPTHALEKALVRLRRAVSGIPAGSIGTVVTVFDDSNAFMMVEFQFAQPEDSRVIDVYEDDLEPAT